MAVLSDKKLAVVDTKVAARDAAIKKFAQCGYVKSAYLAEQFSSPAALDPGKDPNIVRPDRHIHPGGI